LHLQKSHQYLVMVSHGYKKHHKSQKIPGCLLSLCLTLSLGYYHLASTMQGQLLKGIILEEDLCLVPTRRGGKVRS